MNIRTVHLRNFRGFRDVKLELKPLTVLLGSNSSGKSSFGHALAAATHCQRLDPGAQRPTLTPRGNPNEWPVDLGTIYDLRTHGQSGRVYIGLQTEVGWVELGFGGWDPDDTGLVLSHISYPSSPGTTTATPAPSEHGTEFNVKAQTATESINASQLPHVLSSISVHRTKENENIWWDENENQQAVVDLDGLILRSIQHTGRTFMPLRREAQDAIRSLLGGLTYLQPTRMRPSRSYKNDIGAWQRIGYAGEGTPALLQQEGDKPISFPDPAPIPHSMEQAKAVLGKNWEARDSTLLGAVNVWLEKLGLASSVRPKYFEQDRRNLQISVSLPGQEPHDITEIGFGVSQVIPVLTAGLMQSEGSLFIVDLPEAHLHPWPQARLADFFCSLALSGRSSLIETHSEMFFHQLRLRAEMYPALNKEIAVYFVDEPKDGECSPPRAIGLSSKGQLRWPAGFLAEAWDTEKHIKFIREARGGER